MSAFRRSLLASAALLGATSTAASAAPAVLTQGSLVDAGSDGRMVLTTDRLIDRQSGAIDDFTGLGLTPLDLASSSRRVLLSRPNADGTTSLTRYDLERTSGSVLWLDANIGPGNTSVPWGGHAKLVRDGAAVVFDTAEPTPRIIEFAFGAPGGGVVRMTGATLLDASEDGRVITYRRELPVQRRPAGQAPLPQDREIGGAAVGYQVTGEAPRIVAASTAVQSYVEGLDTGACELRTAEWHATTPTGLQVSQDGTRNAYALYLRTAHADTSYGSYDVVSRVTGGGLSTLADAGNPSRRVELFPDPISGAYGLVTTAKPNGPVLNTPQLVGADGAARALGVVPVPGPGGSYDDSGFYTRIVPTGRGASAIYGAVPVTRDPSLSRPTIYVNSGDALSADNPLSAWLDLPRAADRPDGAAIATDVTWAQCDEAPAPVAGTFDDYARFTLRATGNSAGTLWFTAAPDGVIAASSLKASISWLGLQLWSRTLTRDGVIRLPAIPAGISGLRGTAMFTLADGAVLRASTPLRRTR
ncbi:MAG: hypothetical protein J7513_00260 [Solirubrobacteraceae bacterium]|nr:hypothetical protein [Solirubrobacteraceae bacterium]